MDLIKLTVTEEMGLRTHHFLAEFKSNVAECLVKTRDASTQTNCSKLAPTK